MPALPDALAETLTRLDVRIAETGADRARLLDAAAVARSGKRAGAVGGEVAERLSISPEWARQLLLGRKMPNVPDLTELAEFCGIEEGVRFFTDPAATVPNRELGGVLRTLEQDGDSDGPLADLATRHGVVTLALRGQRLTRRRQEALAVMLEGLLGVDDEEARR